MRKAYINNIASYLPPKIMTNHDFEKIVETSDEWIFTRTGIKERRIADEDVSAGDLGLLAAKECLKKSSISPSEIDCVIVATMTPDYLSSPATACLIQSQIGASKAASFDISAACSGFIYGLSVAKAFITSAQFDKILFICTEKMSSILDFKDRTTCVLFGDGASACLISNEPNGFEVLDITLGSDGANPEFLYIPDGGSKKLPSEIMDSGSCLKMNGREIFKRAVRCMEMTSLQCLSNANIDQSHLSWFVPHQANIRIIDSLAKRFNLKDDQIYKTVHKYGNTSAASIPMALDEMIEKKVIQSDSYILLSAFGGGLTYGSALIKSIQ